MATITPELASAADPATSKQPTTKRDYPGALVVVEGIDGSGKSTQLYLLKRWLEIGGYRIHFTEWNSSPLVKSATRRAAVLPTGSATSIASRRCRTSLSISAPRWTWPSTASSPAARS